MLLSVTSVGPTAVLACVDNLQHAAQLHHVVLRRRILVALVLRLLRFEAAALLLHVIVTERRPCVHRIRDAVVWRRIRLHQRHLRMRASCITSHRRISQALHGPALDVGRQCGRATFGLCQTCLLNQVCRTCALSIHSTTRHRARWPQRAVARPRAYLQQRDAIAHRVHGLESVRPRLRRVWAVLRPQGNGGCWVLCPPWRDAGLRDRPEQREHIV